MYFLCISEVFEMEGDKFHKSHTYERKKKQRSDPQAQDLPQRSESSGSSGEPERSHSVVRKFKGPPRGDI